MGMKRGAAFVVKGIFRLFAYPFIRPMEGIMQSSRRMSAEINEYRELRARRVAREEEDQASAVEGVNLAQLDGQQRFEALVVAHGWTPAQLAQQFKTVRRTKLVAICASIVGTILAMASMFMVPVWTMLFIAPGAALIVMMGLIRMLQFGLFQAQLEQRRLLKFRHYLSRRDLFSHLFS